MHFAHLANTLLKDEESPRDNILLACNFAKYSPIRKFTERLNIGASQPLNSGTLSLYLSVPVPVLTPSVVISRPTTASRPSTPLNPSPLAPQIRLCWPLCALINYIYLLTYCAKRCTCWQRSLQLRASQLLARQMTISSFLCFYVLVLVTLSQTGWGVGLMAGTLFKYWSHNAVITGYWESEVHFALRVDHNAPKSSSICEYHSGYRQHTPSIRWVVFNTNSSGHHGMMSSVTSAPRTISRLVRWWVVLPSNLKHRTVHV